MTMQEEMQRYTDLAEKGLRLYLPAIQEEYRIVNDAMRYSIHAGGKRIRPILTFAVCEMLGGKADDALPFGCALECIHTSSLIHDDLPCMDDDELRRGNPSCHIAYGEANALLAGDALILRAFEILCKATMKPENIVRAASILAKKTGIEGMIGGQVLDLANEEKEANGSTLQQMHLLKTGALIQAACLLGGLAADASEEDLKKLSEYAAFLGLAFQICDDILDVSGEEELLGKPIGSDEKSKKSNFISCFGLEQSKRKATEYTEKAIEVLSGFPNHTFLLELTSYLLNRRF